MKFEDALSLFAKNHNYAVRSGWVKDPVAWALNETLKEATKEDEKDDGRTSKRKTK